MAAETLSLACSVSGASMSVARASQVSHRYHHQARRSPTAASLRQSQDRIEAAVSVRRGMLTFPSPMTGCAGRGMGRMAYVGVSLDQRRRGGLVIVARSGGQPYRPPRISTGPRRGQNQNQDSGREEGPLLNTDIRAPQVRLLDQEQNMVGVVSTSEALSRARGADLDLVMISPDADPPVVRIMDYSKYRYELQKKKREAQKKAAASRQVLKELKMRYNIDTHDYHVRQRAAQRFLKDGDKVKVVCQFKGREMDFKDLAVKLFQRFQDEIGPLAVVETKISLEGRTMFMVLAPNKVAIEKEKAAAQSLASKGKTKDAEKTETTADEESAPPLESSAPTLETSDPTLETSAPTLETSAPTLETQASV